MNLQTHLKIGSPIIWVQTPDIHEVEDACIQNSSRTIYLMDPMKGLCVFDRDLDEYKVLLAEVSPGVYDKIGGLVDAMMHLSKEDESKSSLLISFAPDAKAKALEELFVFFTRGFTKATKKNNIKDLPIQIVFVSTASNVPDEISSLTSVVGFDVPDHREIYSIVKQFIDGDESLCNEVFSDKVLAKTVEAVSGLSRAGIREALAFSILETKTVDPQYLEKYKKTLIKQRTSLELIKSNVGLDDIGGLDNLKKTLEVAVEYWKNPEEYAQYNVMPLRRILLIGVPGTGKSATCKAVANTLGIPLAKFGVSQMMNKYIGESEKNMRNAFKQLRALKPVVAWIDEFGRDTSGSHSSNDSGTTDRVHGEFLTGIQELDDEIFLLCAANRIDGLPPEMLRAGRFDKIFFVGFPALEERLHLFSIFLKNINQDFNIQQLAESTAMWTGAEIENLIKTTQSEIGLREKRLINNNDLLARIPEEKNRLWLNRRQEMLAMYKKAYDSFEWASSVQKANAEVILNKAGSSQSIKRVGLGA